MLVTNLPIRVKDDPEIVDALVGKAVFADARVVGEVADVGDGASGASGVALWDRSCCPS